MIETWLSRIDHCPTPQHVVALAEQILQSHGFLKIRSFEGITDEGIERGFVSRGGTIIAWRHAKKFGLLGARIVGAHTDSPGLHIKPNPDTQVLNWQQLQVEIYGGPLLNSWLDRDLHIAGHVVFQDGAIQNFVSQHPVARVSQLAIHLDRDVNDKGLVLHRHQHLTPMWSVDQPDLLFTNWLATQVQANQDDIASWSAQLADAQRGAIIGQNSEFIASARIDNQVSCWAAIDAVIQCSEEVPMVVALFDHEEVGSESSVGAGGPMLEHTLEQLCLSTGLQRSGYLEFLEKSHCLSVDNSHAVHPNYLDRHEGNNAPLINHGVVVKRNANQRYATSAQSVLPVIAAAAHSELNLQSFSSRNNMACGSTIGPITSTRLGVSTVDVGIPQLSMHSIREMCGVQDAQDLLKLLTSYFSRP